ncbi:MAG: family 1 glycosylhydrolase, partial [Candidatus Omnitrophica bacterium]|nr:family 1 glycosylhydrolase [Candidatus Omnitrophota bacterium]
MFEFPKDFLWGSAIAAHQVEGNNIYNDWWKDEIKGVFKFRSADACKHYELYQKDFDLAKALNHNALRLSIEWSRVEPEKGRFNEKELEHYRQVIRALKERNIEPIITLHHFTSPIWFNQLGGWQNKKAVAYFLEFVEKIVGIFCSDVRYWVTINEPMIYIYFGYLLGIWPPHKKGIFNSISAFYCLVSAHIKTYKIIHRLYQENNLPRPLVSVAANLRYFFACRKNFPARFSAYLRDKIYNLWFLESLSKHKALDYLGINYYTKEDICKDGHPQVEKNSLDWDIYPQGLYEM